MPDAQLLTRGKVEGAAIANGATTILQGPSGTNMIHCEGDSTLVLEVDMTGGATGDLVIAVQPFEADGATIMPIPVPQVQGVGPTLNGGHVYQYGQWDVSGLDAVQVRVTNNNAAPQTITRASWRLT